MTTGQQSQAIRNVLKTVGKPLSSTEIGVYFKGAKKDRVSELLELLDDFSLQGHALGLIQMKLTGTAFG